MGPVEMVVYIAGALAGVWLLWSLASRHVEAVTLTAIGLVAGVMVMGSIGGILLGFLWLLWHLYTWVVPQFFPEGREVWIRPGYWLFAGAWVLLVQIVRLLRGRGRRQRSS